MITEDEWIARWTDRSSLFEIVADPELAKEFQPSTREGFAWAVLALFPNI